MLVDTHTHLNFEAFEDDWQKVVARAFKAGVKKMIVVGTDVPSSKRAVELAEQSPNLFASVGIHPHHARGLDSRFKIQDSREKIKELAEHPKVVAIGEVGLDFHKYQVTRYKIQETEEEWKKLVNLQKKLLGVQVEIAKKVKKPLILHSREAGREVVDVIEHFCKKDGKMPKGVFHCFDGSKKYLKQVLEWGFWVSFTGNITYVPDRARVAKEVPLEKLLLETDCPFMPPYAKASGGKPQSKQRSEPRDVVVIAEFHAEARNLGIDEIMGQTGKNARNLFGF